MQRTYKVFKFGGASVRDAEAVRNVASILRTYQGEKIVVVISAMGKTTNQMEALLAAYYGQDGTAQEKLELVRQAHYQTCVELLSQPEKVIAHLNDLLVEIEWILEEEPHPDYNFTYDQIVSIGELLSTRIVCGWLDEAGIDNQWCDARDVIQTDNSYRHGNVDWKSTLERAQIQIKPALEQSDLVITQGFIGSTSENFTTTLGREGSDYSAAILAFCLDAVSVHIWKDVPGVLTADPKLFENVSLIDRMSYREAIEMTYYGAKVIHPKTIKPLQNKSIPLFVKSFQDPAAEGSWIGTDLQEFLPPIIVLAKNQSLLHIATTDYSFVAENHLSEIFALFAKHHLKINLMRNTAISFSVCVQREDSKFQAFRQDLNRDLKVVYDHDLELLTVRHCTDGILERLTKGKQILFEERFKDTVQLVIRQEPSLAPRDT